MKTDSAKMHCGVVSGKTRSPVKLVAHTSAPRAVPKPGSCSLLDANGKLPSSRSVVGAPLRPPTLDTTIIGSDAHC